MTLPGISDIMLHELQLAVGEKWVLVERAAMEEFTDAYWPEGDETYAAAAVVQPATTAEVQAVVRIANRHGIPLWPLSQGKNLGHGGPSPRLRGSIQLGLQRMNQILEINDELAYAVVEPGVTWQDLHDEVTARGLSLLTPSPDLGWGSVVGNSLDNGHTYQHYGADYMMPTGLEVVLADGELLRTGQGAVPGSPAWHLYKRSLGPSLDPLFMQSNFGVVTRMGVWLKRLPSAYAPLSLFIDEDADLERAIDTIRELRLAGHLEGVPAVYSTLRAAHMIQDLPVVARSTPFTPEELGQIGRERGVGAWAVRAFVWGDRELVEYRVRQVVRAWAEIASGRIGEIRIFSADEYAQIEGSVGQIGIGIPTLAAIRSTPPNIGHVDISPVVPLRGTDVRLVVTELRHLFADAGLNFGAGIMVTGERSSVVIAGIRYDRTDAASTHAAFELGRRVVQSLGSMGFADGRPHLEFMDLAAEQHSFNRHAYRRFVELLKDAVDPRGILAPGRHGVWPERYRSSS